MSSKKTLKIHTDEAWTKHREKLYNPSEMY